MKKLLTTIAAILLQMSMLAAQPKTTPLYVDSDGVMRRTSDDKEVSYCGVNYTMPFAHSYRMADKFNIDRFKAIDNDVYHFARLGFNAFRLHIWDVEISDAQGNLLENDHLRTLDYLIQKLEERHIDIILTAQTNFGNGYPERNIITDGFTYHYDKCRVHSEPEAVKAQQNYIKQLALHRNAFTGKTYSDDEGIVAFEINNEPCHSVSKDDTRDYIVKMVDALKSTGFNKTILYNVSHNHDFVEAYFQSPIDGGTYQWYPTGLVSGRTLSMNFLPYVDDYEIDFKDVAGFRDKAKVVYEFDPGDVIDSYLYPAVMRTFRTAGFQWVTQFAYDATFLAEYNTDYQTHYLNLAYTPGKAVGMKIACEVAKEVPMYAKFPKYPNDTVFNSTTVSYKRNLALFNNGRKYFYTNDCNVKPVDYKKLTEICGVGESPVVKYSGTGAYFVDKIADGVWRLEVMPDYVALADPFAKPSLARKTGVTVHCFNAISIDIPNLGADFAVVDFSHDAAHNVDNGVLSVKPGVYILRSSKSKYKGDYNVTFNNIKSSEYYAPKSVIDKVYVSHHASPIAERDKDLELDLTLVAPGAVDSVVVLPSTASFWSSHNKSARMTSDGKYGYRCNIPHNWFRGNVFGYYVLVYRDGGCTTFPSGRKGTPLDWDSDDRDFYRTELTDPQSPVVLVASAAGDEAVIAAVQPSWGRSQVQKKFDMPFSQNSLSVASNGSKNAVRAIIYKDVTKIAKIRAARIAAAKTLCVEFEPAEHDMELSAGFVDADGLTFTKSFSVKSGEHQVRIPLSELTVSSTFFVRETYPSFCKQSFEPEGNFTLDMSQIAVFEIVTKATTEPFKFGFVGAWIE